MTKEDVEQYIQEAYPSFDSKLISLENQLVKILEYYMNERSELFDARDFRPGTVGRMISSLIAVRFFLKNTTEFIKSENWADTFQEQFTPAPFKGNGYYGHFKDFDVQIRFNLFHQFYHQLETTHRIICRKLELKDKKKPIERVNDLTESFPPEFIEYFEAIRNTIHNNGYYQPVSKNQRKEFTYELPPFSLTFKENERIELGMDETLFTIKQLIEYLNHMLRHQEIEKIEITPDKN